MPSKLLPSTAVASALISLAIISPARGETTNAAFASFVTVCGQPAADLAGVRAAADAHGWAASDAPPDPAMGGITVSNHLTRASKAAGASLILSAWQGTTKGGVKVSACTVHAEKAPFQPVREAAASWLSVPPVDDSAKKAVFRFTDANGAHRALLPAEYDAAAAAGGLEILTVSGDANGAVLDLLVIRK
jgi:hypothetical protein